MRADSGMFVRYYAVFFRAEPDTGKLIPTETGIDGLYPNPANPSTTLHYSLSQPSHIKIVLYNILGRQVRTLYNGNKQAGQWTVHWDGTNSKGLSVSSGVYFLKMIVQEESGKIRHIHKQKIMFQK
ncbi:MAG: T9SS type A sorting domain-containing protein [candidate division KSB1 bacterium]|nr:T9SS type A sorting domain-containing protein [candidate division KSB1 bacterium]